MSESVIMADDQPVDPDDEMLVAYLDGELSNQQRDQVEQRLVDDEVFRRRLQKLQASWDWLGELPAEAPSEKLMQSTIELVVADLGKPDRNLESWLSRYRSIVLTALFSVICLFGGGLFVQYRAERQRQQELVDLELAENLNAYVSGSNLDLIRDLNASVPWKSMISTFRADSDQQWSDGDLVTNVAISERPQRIEQLSVSQREVLENRWEQLQRMPKSEREAIRRVSELVKSQPDSEDLLRTMRDYVIWKEWIPAEYQDNLEKLEGSARRQAIERAVEYSLEQLSRDSGRLMSDETAERIYYQLKRLLQARMDVDDNLAASVERHAQRMDEDNSRRFHLFWMLRPPGNRGGPGGGIGGRDDWFTAPPPITDDELDAMIAILDDEAIEYLNALTNWNPFTGRDPGLTLTVMKTWGEESIRRQRPKEDREIDWLKLYREHPERDELDMLPSDEFFKRLERYNRWLRGPWREGSGRGGRGGEGRGGEGRGGPGRGGPGRGPPPERPDGPPPER